MILCCGVLPFLRYGLHVGCWAVDAEVRIGQLFKALPKAKNQHESASNTGVTSKKSELSNSGVTYIKPKNEAQDLAGALLDAEVRIGQLFKALPKAKNQHESASTTGGTSTTTKKASGERTDLQPSTTGVTRSTTKQETIENLGFNKMQASRFETLAERPERF